MRVEIAHDRWNQFETAYCGLSVNSSRSGGVLFCWHSANGNNINSGGNQFHQSATASDMNHPDGSKPLDLPSLMARRNALRNLSGLAIGIILNGCGGGGSNGGTVTPLRVTMNDSTHSSLKSRGI
jgi:hypothetical protein